MVITGSSHPISFQRYEAQRAKINRLAVAQPPLKLLSGLLVGLTLAVLMLAVPAAWAAQDVKPTVILVLGDSLSAGYNLPPNDAFPAQLERALTAQGHAVRVINGGVSGDTSAGGRARLDWMLADRPQVAIVELGANDALRGLSPEKTEANLDQILTTLKERGVTPLLAGMIAPPNMGADYGKAFNGLYGRLAAQHGVALYPFFLEGVAARPEVLQSDGMHPTAEGVADIVRRILPQVEALLPVSAPVSAPAQRAPQ
jgi:acyl-CoA thioesterase-1